MSGARTTSGSRVVRMADVAAAAGVSLMTVSRALRQPEKLSEKTRNLVLETIRRIGYVPNGIAASLASSRSSVVGQIVPSIQNSLYANTVQGTADVLKTAGLHLLLANPDSAFGPVPLQGRDALLLAALADGMAKLQAKLGSDSSQWQWGRLHHIQFEHPLSPVLKPELAKAFATPRYPVAGDNETVHRATFRRSDFRVTSGASYRQVIDVSNWDNSVAQNVPGQSADPRSPYYKNLIEGWATGKYFPMAFSRAKVESELGDALTLRPSAGR